MKLRVRSSKLGKVRFVSHRDAARIWERALRRAELPIAHTEGFTPRPKLSFGLALPTGAESVAEYTDIELRADGNEIELTTLPQRLSDVLPTGFDVLAVAEWNDKGSLQQQVTACTWELWSPDLSGDDYRRAPRLLDEESLMIERERKGKTRTDDVRPMIIDVQVGDNSASRPYTNTPHGDRLIVELATTGRSLRPSEFAQLAFPEHDARNLRALRIHQWIDDDGRRRSVLDTAATPAAVTSADEVLV